MTEIQWVVLILWLALMVLSQIFRDKDMKDALLAIDSVIGFVVTLTLWGEGQAVVGLAIGILSLYTLFTALADW